MKKLTMLFVLVVVAVAPQTGYSAKKDGKVSHSKHAKVSKSKAKVTSKRKHITLTKGVIGKKSKYLQQVKHQVNKQKLTPKSYRISEPLPDIENNLDGPLSLASTKALVINQNTNEVLFAKNTNWQTPIASVTKLMTAMVLLDANLNLNELVQISDEDVDYIKGTSSRLALGAEFTRHELLHMALISSENRAASALATSYPGGKGRFIREMNQKARNLGMTNTHFSDSTGLDSNNMSTAEDLAKMVNAAYQYAMIRNITTTPDYEIYLPKHTSVSRFNNTNSLVKSEEWDIGLSKTGYISEAGRCLVMQAKLAGEPVIIVLLDSVGKYTRIGDANRVKKWIEHHANLGAFDKQTTDEEIAATVY